MLLLQTRAPPHWGARAPIDAGWERWSLRHRAGVCHCTAQVVETHRWFFLLAAGEVMLRKEYETDGAGGTAPLRLSLGHLLFLCDKDAPVAMAFCAVCNSSVPCTR